MKSTTPHFNFAGKVALVIGWRPGIGKAIVIGPFEAAADIIGVSASLALTGSEVAHAVTLLSRTFKGYG